MIVAHVSIRDNTQAFTEALRDELCARLQTAADEVVRRGRELINIDGEFGKFPSSPGEPPHRDSSFLYLSVDSEPVDRANLSIRCGSGASYALYLELGTSKMAPRPWLRPALRDSEGFIRHTFLAALPQSRAAFRDNTRGISLYESGGGF